MTFEKQLQTRNFGARHEKVDPLSETEQAIMWATGHVSVTSIHSQICYKPRFGVFPSAPFYLARFKGRLRI